MLTKPFRFIRIALLGLILPITVEANAAQLTTSEKEASGCPWIVQPDEPLFGLGSDIATYEILFAGNTTDAIFYGFTVADQGLAQQLTNDGEIPDLEKNGRSLKTVKREGLTVYQVSSDSISPRTIYLLTAATAMLPLERIDARIDPARPIAVGLRTRGATDFNGPLPRRTVPGREILASSSEDVVEDRSIVVSSLGPDFQLCAYQVSWN